MTGQNPAPADPQWLEHRRRLHARYEELAGLADASRLSFLHGEPQRWTEADVANIWHRAANAADRRRDAVNHVYIHVPFCKSICNFCNYERLRPSRPGLLEEYTERMLRSLATMAPVVDPLKWHTLYIGGGTPSTLPPKLLKKILVAVDEHLRWHPNSTRFFEFDPAIMNTEKLEVLLEHGFEHFSFGVQTMTTGISVDHNRGPQSPEIIYRRFEELRAAGVHNISCDFLLGLKGTTPEQMVTEIEEVLALRPRWIDLYYLTPTHEYVASHFAGDLDAFWKHIRPFHERIPQLVREAAHRNGFRVRKGHGHNIIIYRQMGPHERSTKKKGLFSYTQLVDQQRRPLHLLGLGTSARSLIFGQAAIECRDPDDDQNGDHYYIGHEYGMEGEIRLFLSHMLRDNDVIDRAMFLRIFGSDILDAIPEAISAWDAMGLIDAITEEEFRLVHQPRLDRARALMWAVPEKDIQHEVDRCEANLVAQARKREGGVPQPQARPA